MDWPDVSVHLTGFAHLATSTPDGSPHVSMVMPYVEDDTIWVFTRGSSGKAARVASNGKVALMWRPGAEVYVYGTAELVHDLDEKLRLWAKPDLPFPPSSFFASADDPDHVLIRIAPTRAIVMTDGGDGIRRLSWQR
jgi:general stress protein 26